MSVVLENKAPVKTVFGYASVRDEKGQEMHKSKGNAIWFDEAVEKVGADPMRWLYARQNPAENLKFGYGPIEEIKRRLLILWNSFIFFETYGSKESLTVKKPKNILDRWILSRLNSLLEEAEKNLNKYDAARFTISLERFFIDDLSLWYIRRSRKRFQQTEGIESSRVLGEVLLTITKLMAPIAPFLSENLYQKIRNGEMPESVHLCPWPKTDKKYIDRKLEKEMEEVRTVVTMALAERAALGIKVRQPLQSITLKKASFGKNQELQNLITDEINIRKILFDGKQEKGAVLNATLTVELIREGRSRELVRHIQEMRKKAGLTPRDSIEIFSNIDPESVNTEYVEIETKAENFSPENIQQIPIFLAEIMLEGKKYQVGIRKIG